MKRAIYHCLVWMHPPFFRREFGAEMLWIYDQAALEGNAGSLFLDALISLVRQWCIRSGYWKFVAALAGAFLQVTLGGSVFRILRFPIHPASAAVDRLEMAALINLATYTAVGLIAAVMLLVFWWRRLARRTGA